MVQTREQINEKRKERKAKNRANGKCGCGQNRVKNSTQCEVCISHQKKYNDKRVKKGLCYCGRNPPMKGLKNVRTVETVTKEISKQIG